MIHICLNYKSDEHLCLQEAGRADRRLFELGFVFPSRFHLVFIIENRKLTTSCNPSNTDEDANESQAFASPWYFPCMLYCST